MSRDVRGNCPGQMKMETLITGVKKWWNNFIEGVGNIFNTMSAVCVISFAYFVKGH